MSNLKMMPLVAFLTLSSACGTTPTLLPILPPPAEAMLPPTPLASLRFQTAGPVPQLSDVERQKKRETLVCSETEQRLLMLQEWARSVSE